MQDSFFSSVKFSLVWYKAVLSLYLSSSLIYEEPVPPGPALVVPDYAVLQLAVHPGVTVPRLDRLLHTAGTGTEGWGSLA